MCDFDRFPPQFKVKQRCLGISDLISHAGMQSDRDLLLQHSS